MEAAAARDETITVVMKPEGLVLVATLMTMEPLSRVDRPDLVDFAVCVSRVVVRDSLVVVDPGLVVGAGVILLVDSGIDGVGTAWLVAAVIMIVDVRGAGKGAATLMRETCGDWVTITVVGSLGTSIAAGAAAGLVLGAGPSA